ncbi:MAG: PepSY domain-containing protein [Burkholderiales bacterium]|nr:PepSY domain-containing protein [Burkholderiales bacterium]
MQGSLLEQDRFRNWARRLHSRMLQNDAWRWLIELAASWMLIMMMTGIYLWWPRGKATWRDILQWKSGTGGRAAWRYLHSMTSVIMALMTTTILMTGLTWSKYAGSNFRALQQATAQNTPAAPRDLHSDINGMATGSLSWQAIYDKARQVAPDIEMQLTPPKSANGVWRIENSDRSQPEKRFQLALDAYSGQVLYRSAWTDMPALSRATAIGIPFHRGEFGWWNQALLFLVGLSVIFSVISGYVMWLQRRKAATLSAPKITRAHATVIPWWIWACMVTLGVALPVLGVSMCIVLLLESLNLLRNRHWTTA